jgi:hypothetical protein
MNSDGTFVVTEGVAGGGGLLERVLKELGVRSTRLCQTPLRSKLLLFETLLFLRGRRIIPGSLLKPTVPSSSASGAQVREIDR